MACPLPWSNNLDLARSPASAQVRDISQTRAGNILLTGLQSNEASPHEQSPALHAGDGGLNRRRLRSSMSPFALRRRIASPR